MNPERGELIILLLISTIYVVNGCKCQLQKPSFSYCNAHWVAHAKIISRLDNQAIPSGIPDRQSYGNTRYTVSFIRPFKTIKESNGTMPAIVYTPTEDGACGLLLESGHEYLLSGRFVNGTMTTALCGQILLDNLKESIKHDILEWNEVPASLQNQLVNKQFDSSCED